MKNTWTAYSKEADITFIMEEAENTISVVGWYFGEPNDESTMKYTGKLVAEF